MFFSSLHNGMYSWKYLVTIFFMRIVVLFHCTVTNLRLRKVNSIVHCSIARKENISLLSTYVMSVSKLCLCSIIISLPFQIPLCVSACVWDWVLAMLIFAYVFWALLSHFVYYSQRVELSYSYLRFCSVTVLVSFKYIHKSFVICR